MQIKPINQSVKPTFGNIIASEKAIAYLNANLKPKQIKEFNQKFAEQDNKKPDLVLKVGNYVTTALGRHTNHEYLRADVGKKYWTDRFFNSTFGVIKKALNYIENFDGELEINQKLLKKGNL